MSSHGTDATTLPGQTGPKHGQTKRLCTTTRKSGPPLHVRACHPQGSRSQERWGVKRSSVQIHTHQSHTTFCPTAPAVNHRRAWGRHATCLDPREDGSWMIIEFLLAGNIYNHLRSSRIAILPGFLCYPGSPVFISNVTESGYVWNVCFSQTSC